MSYNIGKDKNQPWQIHRFSYHCRHYRYHYFFAYIFWWVIDENIWLYISVGWKHYFVFLISGILAFPIELFVKAIPKVLFSHFKKINAFEAKVIFVVLDTFLSMVMFSMVDYFMKSVSATPISLFVVSFVMSLLCMNDVIENKDR